ncbi:hypothetical protein [Streptomyces sp. Root264]|uniref:hypothetical protein n=1 Tax=Streptomyces sp. Root264 TaxID=1736503 RepID=UPI0012FEAFCF|nr:hypothetical protein [Streptomyces sp. Root264]
MATAVSAWVAAASIRPCFTASWEASTSNWPSRPAAVEPVIALPCAAVSSAGIRCCSWS